MKKILSIAVSIIILIMAFSCKPPDSKQSVRKTPTEGKLEISYHGNGVYYFLYQKANGEDYFPDDLSGFIKSHDSLEVLSFASSSDQKTAYTVLTRLKQHTSKNLYHSMMGQDTNP